MEITVKKVIKYGVLLPIAAIWTAWFWCIKKIYKGSKYINQRGDAVIADLVERLNEDYDKDLH